MGNVQTERETLQSECYSFDSLAYTYSLRARGSKGERGKKGRGTEGIRERQGRRKGRKGGDGEPKKREGKWGEERARL